MNCLFLNIIYTYFSMIVVMVSLQPLSSPEKKFSESVLFALRFTQF